MRVVGLPRSFYQLSKTTPQQLTPEAQERRRWASCWQTLRQQGLTSSAATQALGLPQSTLYRWHKALREEGPAGRGPGGLSGYGVRHGALICLKRCTN